MHFDWKKLVGTVAPGIATALGGPLAGLAVSALSRGLLGKEDGTEDEVAAAVAGAKPEDLLKLKQIEQQFILDMKKADIDVFTLEVQDKASARALFTINIWPQLILSAVFVVGYFTLLYMLFFGKIVDIPEKWIGTAQILLGVLTTNIPLIMAFWFGSSMGSKEKTAALAASKPADS